MPIDLCHPKHGKPLKKAQKEEVQGMQISQKVQKKGTKGKMMEQWLPECSVSECQDWRLWGKGLQFERQEMVEYSSGRQKDGRVDINLLHRIAILPVKFTIMSEKLQMITKKRTSP